MSFTLSPPAGSVSQSKRRGRGIGSGLGKTGGRGHKGQKSRAGGSVPHGFEGGQNPLHRRLPKFGFTSLKGRYAAKLRLSSLNKLEAQQAQDITVVLLAEKGLVPKNTKQVKVYLHGEIQKSVKLIGISASKGARQAIEAAGGQVVDS